MGLHLAWRANDIVAFAAVVDAANSAVAAVLRLGDDGAILRLGDDGAMLHAYAAEAASAIRREVAKVDGFERATIDALLARLNRLIADYEGTVP